MSEQQLKGKEANPYAYEYRRIRQALGWKLCGYLMPPPAQTAFKAWWQAYKRTHKDEFNIKKGV